MAQAPAARETAAIRTPVRTMASGPAPEVPAFSISATRVGITSPPITSSVSRTMVAAHSFQWGLRNRRISFMGV